MVVLVLLVGLNTTKIASRPFNADRPGDFRPPFVGQWLLRQGIDPYQDAHLVAGWHRIVRAEGLVSRTAPGPPDERYIYPPWATALLGLLFGRLPYAVAWPLNYALALAALAVYCLGTARALARLLPGTAARPALGAADFGLLALALKGTVAALLMGQLTYLALGLAGAAWAAAEAGRRNGAGLLLGLAAFKITVALPWLGYFLLTGRWRSLAVAAGVGAVLMGLFWWWAAAPLASLAHYRALLADVQAAAVSPAHPDYPLGYAMISEFGLANLLEFLRPGLHRAAPVAGLVLAVAAGGRLLALWRTAPAAKPLANQTPPTVPLIALRFAPGARRLYALLLLALLALLFSYHLFYNALLLLPLLAYARAWNRPRINWLLSILALPNLLPLNALLDRLGQPPLLHVLYFALPLSALGLLLALLWLGPAPAEIDRRQAIAV